MFYHDLSLLEILIYEMLCGIPPFYNENIDKMYELIKGAELRFPKKIRISTDAQDIITKVTLIDFILILIIALR